MNNGMLERVQLFNIFVKNSGLLKRAFYTIILILAGSSVFGQKDSARVRKDSLPEKFYLLQKVTRDGVTLPEMEIKEVTIPARKKTGGGFQAWRYQRLVYNVKTVYPYAVVVRDKLSEVNDQLIKIQGDRERKEFVKGVEKQVLKDYEGKMRDLTMTQGKILIRLIDRETNNTSYELIKEYKGKISAAFWQGIARICGTNLKDEYDPEGDDELIEKIVTEIEAGRL
jgi:hypothetical protein